MRRIRWWWNRLLCKRLYFHKWERRGSWSRCIRQHRSSQEVWENGLWLCYEHERDWSFG